MVATERRAGHEDDEQMIAFGAVQLIPSGGGYAQCCATLSLSSVLIFRFREFVRAIARATNDLASSMLSAKASNADGFFTLATPILILGYRPTTGVEAAEVEPRTAGVPQTCRKRNSTDRYGLIPEWPLL
jgi:hypothetical protein